MDKMSSSNLPAHLEQCINRIIENEGITTYNVGKKTITPNGGGYMGILYEIDIKGETPEGAKEVNLFLKNIVQNADQMKIYSVADVFKREHFAYKVIFKIFTELQDEANISLNERYKMVKCYYESNPETIILENLSRKGYKTYYRMDVVSPKYAKLSVEQLAKFHSLSYVLQQQRPDYFKEKVKTLKQPFNFGVDWYDFVKNMFNYSIKMLDDDIRKDVKSKIYDIVNKYPQYMNECSPFGTLCHGDYKHNNIMVKEIHGEPSDVITIDFQMLHYGCPVIDLLYFIFNGTDEKFRKENLMYLKDTYYETMQIFLLQFNIVVEDVFPREQFEKLFKEKLNFGLMINFFYVPFLFAAEDDVPDVTEPLGDISFKVDPRFRERLRGVVKDFIQWGYI